MDDMAPLDTGIRYGYVVLVEDGDPDHYLDAIDCVPCVCCTV